MTICKQMVSFLAITHSSSHSHRTKMLLIPCYEPDSVAAHATYAFDTYDHQMGKASEACDFNGVATITATDPSHGSCVFPGSVGKNGSLVNLTAPSLNSTSADSSACNLYNVAFTNIVMVVGILTCSAAFL